MPKKKIRVLTASFLAAAFVITAGFAVQGHVRATQYRRLLDNGYLHAFAELTTASSELEVALTKMSHATSPALFASLCAQAYSKAQAAQAALGELPYGNVDLEQTAAFLARAGDYAMALAQGTSAELVCSDEHRDTLYQLSQAAGELSLTLETLQAQLTAGAIQPEDLAQAQDRLAADDGSGQVNGGSAFQSVESDFPEVPTLIYDGPFSQHLDGRTPRMLEGLPQVTEEEARQAAASFLGLRPEVFTLTARSEGNLPAYGFTAMVDGGQLYIQVTCQGGRFWRYSPPAPPERRHSAGRRAVKKPPLSWRKRVTPTWLPAISWSRTGCWPSTSPRWKAGCTATPIWCRFRWPWTPGRSWALRRRAI